MSELVTVDISQGRLRGRKVTSSTTGATYYSFQGVPYAKPPVGPLRFKAPEEPEPWTGTRDATEEGSVSLHNDVLTKERVGSEDCLFLNVYTPRCGVTSRRAVMVWIHGGGLFWGSGNTDLYGPDFLVAEDVVLVTINYRLGALGFLYLDGADVTGNNGLRDQVMALRWVQANIAQFGGDPGNVTIFGESAGAASVQYMTLTPSASGLFHRAIAQSGAALIRDFYHSHDFATQTAVSLARTLGCASEDTQQVADFLRTLPAETFVPPHSESLELAEVLKRRFMPCEELGPGAFLSVEPRELLLKGRFNKVPFMSGVTSAEAKFFFTDAAGSMKLSETADNFEQVYSPFFAPGSDAEKTKEISDNINKFYFGEVNTIDDKVSRCIDVISDAIFVYPLHEVVRMLTRHSAQPTYVYLFDHVSAPGVGPMPSALDHLPGAMHMSELPYLFQSTIKPTNFSPDTPDGLFFKTFIKLWTQFAKTGNPTEGNENVTWLPAVQGQHNYLRMNGGFTMDSDMYKERMDFLDRQYSK